MEFLESMCYFDEEFRREDLEFELCLILTSGEPSFVAESLSACSC
jgi:hypothetical protein